MSVENDIRPISLTPIACKVFESIVLKWVDSVVRPQTDCRQFDSISGTCTPDILVKMVHQWYQATDTQATYVRILLLDFSKAFDLINHTILIDKLETMGLRLILLDGWGAFLLDRKHKAKIGNSESELAYPRALCLAQQISWFTLMICLLRAPYISMLTTVQYLKYDRGT